MFELLTQLSAWPTPAAPIAMSDIAPARPMVILVCLFGIRISWSNMRHFVPGTNRPS